MLYSRLLRSTRNVLSYGSLIPSSLPVELLVGKVLGQFRVFITDRPSVFLELDDLVSPSAAGLSFLLQLATSRPKSTFMGTLGFINSVVSSPLVDAESRYVLDIHTN